MGIFRPRLRIRVYQAPEPLYLSAEQVPLPGWPLGPVAFGPPLAADPTDFGRGAP